MKKSNVKFGIISDIHGNLEALDAVLELLRSEGVDQILCAGDVVGYGPDPAACIERVRQHHIRCAQGNHDEAVASGGHAERMLPEARQAVEWTYRQLNDEDLAWLDNLPRTIEMDGVTVVHASLIPVPRWAYIIDEESALLHFLFQDAPIVFNGHTHVPLLVQHRSGERPRLDLLRSTFIPRNRRLLVGVGAVGQPRDGDPRAACVIYDPAEHFIELRRVGYDPSPTQKKMLRSGLPEPLAFRLVIGR